MIVFLGILVGIGMVSRYIVSRKFPRFYLLIAWASAISTIFACGTFVLMELSDKYAQISLTERMLEVGLIFILVFIGSIITLAFTLTNRS